MSTDLPPIRPITGGAKYHWFGYYDKLQFDPTCHHVLSMEVGFQHRSPEPDDVIKVGMVDLEGGDRWIELGSTRAWCWQQGCMLQWIPGSPNQVVWNDRQGDQFVCHIMNVETRQIETLPHPIYTLSPDGKMAVAPDFRRINDMRPGYGYAGLPDPHKDELAPDDSGIWGIDLTTGDAKLLVSLADVAAIPYERDDLGDAKHYFNHLLFNTDGTRFEFLHRWRKPGKPGFNTRMLTAALDGSDIHVVDDYGHTSHFIWRDPSHILAWSWHPSHEGAFYLYEDGPEKNKVEPVGLGVMLVNGHCTYLPGNEWILNDTYPDGDRLQRLYVYHIASNERVPLADLHSPEVYTGEWRCDLHPRYSPDGRLVTVDSAHGGKGRQIYLVDISDIVG